MGDSNASGHVTIMLSPDDHDYYNSTYYIYKYWFDNLTLVRKLARENINCSKHRQQIHYDRHNRPHYFIVGYNVIIKIQGLKENEDCKIRQQYKGLYTKNYFQSPTNYLIKMRQKTTC